MWYDSRFYRANFFWDKDQFRIRDLHLFDQHYSERYLNDTCKWRLSTYDTLSVMDGYNWSTPDKLAGIRVVALTESGASEPLTGGDPSGSEEFSSDLLISWPLQKGGRLEVLCREGSLEISVTRNNPPLGWALEMGWSPEKAVSLIRIHGSSLRYEHEGFRYEVKCAFGQLMRQDANLLLILPQNNRIVLEFET